MLVAKLDEKLCIIPWSHLHVKAHPVRVTQDNFAKLSGTRLSRGSYLRVYVDVTGSMLLLPGLRVQVYGVFSRKLLSVVLLRDRFM